MGVEADRERAQALWSCLLGPLEGAADPPELRAARPASEVALFVDQSKAFERVPVEWLEKVLRGRGVHGWWLTLLLCFVQPRAAVTILPDGRRIVRILFCGIGMGGPIKPLLWVVSFDPVVYGVGLCVSIPAPTFVDDLAALAAGVRGLWMASIFTLKREG